MKRSLLFGKLLCSTYAASEATEPIERYYASMFASYYDRTDSQPGSAAVNAIARGDRAVPRKLLHHYHDPATPRSPSRLAEDLAAQCGCFAHLTALERTYACGFSIKDAVTLEQLEASEDRAQFVISPEKVFADCLSVELDDNLARLFLNGFAFPASRVKREFEAGIYINVYKDNIYIGLGRITEAGELKKLWQAEEA